MTLPSETPLLDYYEGRSIVIVGGSGLSGTALIYKLVTCTKISHIYVVRGGEEYVSIASHKHVSCRQMTRKLTKIAL